MSKPMIDYTKLVSDLKLANQKAIEAVENMDDGGTANLDRVFLKIPNAREKKVLEAIQQAGLYCRKKTDWIGKGYFLSPNVAGQGDRRSKAVQVMAEELERLGWSVIVFHKND